MINSIIKNSLLIGCSLLLSACSSFFEKDNTPPPAPLAQFTPEANPKLLWATKTGVGTNSQYLKLNPAISDTAIFTSHIDGTVTAVNKVTGQIIWQVKTNIPITTGPGVGDNIVVVGSRSGDIVALSQANGKLAWKTTIADEILAQPTIASGMVIMKTIDGNVVALSTQDGKERWSYQQTEPSLILRGASTPAINNRNVLIGFANGNLAKLTLHDGRLVWLQTIAIPEGTFAIQRMIDIDANPVVFDQHVYAATYQGKIASLDWFTGRTLWSQDISSYTGMAANENSVYVSDAKSHVWAFSADSGLVNWRQTELQARQVSGPILMGNYVVVGDGEGYLHWLSNRDGHFVARLHIGSGIYAAPIVDHQILYAVTKDGYLAAYTLR